MEDLLHFLRELSKNNNRSWFETNRDLYEKNREKILFITDVLIHEIVKLDPEIPPMSPKECIFRIHRDVRFSNDKRPYKTNFGSFIAKHGRKVNEPGYYFHIEPGQSFIGGGLYHPPAEMLKSVRHYIARFPEEFEEIINDPGFRSEFPEMYDDRLKTMPKGFPKDHPAASILCYKSFVFSDNISDEQLISGDFLKIATRKFKKLSEFIALLNEALKTEPN